MQPRHISKKVQLSIREYLFMRIRYSLKKKEMHMPGLKAHRNRPIVYNDFGAL